MVKQILSIGQLQRRISKERANLARASKRQRLESELKRLRSGQRTDIGGRIRRGFVLLSKKTGSVALKQARLIRERQIEEAKKPKKKGGLTGQDNVFAPLDF